ncbi:VQ motif-containing protein 10-like [Ananas comosus]|uniref:VQ motif-containing protein 10-like n=1 Tax=Ananas comosus TaxID=4615 RepID=A0A6P5F170_ANACO|nr:VQ motif-containing protein 10-like [Ananas comosus]
MSWSGNSNAREIKVTVIETQFVQTDLADFKAVVQRLTGRDQTAVAVGAPRVVPQRPRACRGPRFGYAGEEGCTQGCRGEWPAAKAEEPFLDELYDAFCTSHQLL